MTSIIEKTKTNRKLKRRRMRIPKFVPKWVFKSLANKREAVGVYKPTSLLSS